MIAPAADRDDVVLGAEERKGFRLGLVILSGLVVIAFVLATALFGLRGAAFGTVVILLQMLFLSIPCWVAAVEESVDVEHERLTGEVRSIH